MLVNPNQWIENVSWVIVISHTKNKSVHTIVEVNNPILGDCGKIISTTSKNRVGKIKI